VERVAVGPRAIFPWESSQVSTLDGPRRLPLANLPQLMIAPRAIAPRAI
jgi:hypothetical protein